MNRTRIVDDQISLSKAKDPNLILLIKEELDKIHIFDDLEKLAVLLFALTGYLNPAEERKTTNLLGNSSVGKDNLANSVMSLFPNEDILDLTNSLNINLLLYYIKISIFQYEFSLFFYILK